ncbi:MAG: flagellar hook-associated protein FlgL [Desulfobulbaceae bacterium]|nr:flagellar hook-associated protein FlgL [Desulfobulbaceae bacterium]
MRTSESSSYRTMLQFMTLNTRRLQEAQVAVASGKKLGKPSDNPAGVAPMLLAKTQLESTDLFIKNSAAAQDRLKTQGTQLSQADSLLARAIELTVAAGNGVYSAQERAGMANEIKDLRAEMLGVANSQMNGKYFYGGFLDKVAPFSINSAYDPILDPRSVLYDGDNGMAQLEIAPGEQMAVNFPGNAVFLGDENGDGAVDAGQVDIFATLSSLENALLNNDQAGTTAHLDDLYQAQHQIGIYQTKTGNAANRLERSLSDMEDLQIDLKGVVSRFEDVDVAAAITQMTQQEQALQAAMSVTGRISKLSILDYL